MRKSFFGAGVVLAKLILIVLLLLFVFVVGIGTLARAFRGALSGLRNPRERSSSRTRSRNEGKVERMLACSVCGVHVPESEGIVAAGKFFCCEAHRK
jgi:uncharacterized protein